MVQRRGEMFTARLRHETPTGPPVRVVCGGDLDVAARPALEPAIDEALRSDPPDARVEIDLDEVGFIDSAGLQLLMQAVLRLDAAGRPWRLAPSPTVRALLELAGVARFWSDGGGGWLASGGYAA